ncbi:MAG: hypothetical protein HQL60_03715 [Magnetococcales bacterium]|nr:hypothetical protein [Magnetococcales bacterium]
MTSFSERLQGRFDGLIRLADVERLRQAMIANTGWYLIEPGVLSPTNEAAMDGITACHHLDKLVTEILRIERGVWSTLIYVQELEDPWIVKIYHPRRAGCGCGSGSDTILPWWVMTRLQPEPIAEWQAVTSCTTEPMQHDQPAAWWRRLW